MSYVYEQTDYKTPILTLTCEVVQYQALPLESGATALFGVLVIEITKDPDLRSTGIWDSRHDRGRCRMGAERWNTSELGVVLSLPSAPFWLSLTILVLDPT